MLNILIIQFTQNLFLGNTTNRISFILARIYYKVMVISKMHISALTWNKGLSAPNTSVDIRNSILRNYFRKEYLNTSVRFCATHPQAKVTQVYKEPVAQDISLTKNYYFWPFNFDKTVLIFFKHSVKSFHTLVSTFSASNQIV